VRAGTLDFGNQAIQLRFDTHHPRSHFRFKCHQTLLKIT
jgi:hypothetical protein